MIKRVLTSTFKPDFKSLEPLKKKVNEAQNSASKLIGDQGVPIVMFVDNLLRESTI